MYFNNNFAKSIIKEPKNTYELILSEITRRRYEITLDDLDECSPWLVDEFLDGKDYTHSHSTHDEDEEFLARMLYHAIKNNPDTVSNDWFKELFSKLQFQHVTLR